MNKLARNAGIAIAVIAQALFVQGLSLYMIGARINTTLSVPVGLYWRVSGPVSKGSYVLFCPPQVGVFEEAKRRGYIGAGFCAGGFGHMMKKVAAATEDRVEVGKDGVRVNGQLLAMSVPLAADGSQRPMARFQSDSYVLSEHQLLLMGDCNPLSFDARYFGPIQRVQVSEVVIPVFTWGDSYLKQGGSL